jgi:polysaccharide export outer membrane protein
MTFARLLAAALPVLLVACTPPAPNIAVPGAIVGGAPITAEHTLSPNDEIDIRFPFSPQFNDRATIGPDGETSLKALGAVRLGGLTVPEATARLRERFAAKFRDTELSITVRAYAPQTVYVDGWVNRPGLVRSEVPLTVARALARAGGARTGARTDDILVIRRDAGGRLQASRVALGNFAGAGAEDPLLRSFDIVYVPRTAIAAVADILGQYAKSLPFSATYNIVPAAPSITTQIINTPAAPK